MGTSVRTLADGRITVVALDAAHKAADPKNPTVAELNAGQRLEMYVMKSDYKLGSKGSTSVEEPVLGAQGKGTVPGPAEYEGQMSVYWYFDDNGQYASGGDNKAWELLAQTGREFDIYEREGKLPTAPFAAGDRVDWYHIAPGQPQKPDDRTTYTKRTITLFISDALENSIVLGGGATAAPVISSIDPTNKKAGDMVTISGSNFIGVSSVTCTAGGKTTPVTLYTVASPTVIVAVLPDGVQTGNFIVTNAKGASSGFLYKVGA
jgi:IPT/TIG domain